MPRYLISFNDGAMDHIPAEEIPQVGKDAHAVIQEAVNAQNRSFTTLSNVLKAQHDTVKTAIGNIR